MGAELAINPPSVGLQAGAVIGGRYQILGVVSYGAMGIIYRARHRTLGIELALKAMRPELVAEESYHRFADEARNAAQLKSEHVARVFDFGRLPGGELYLVMELLEGDDLSEVLAASGPLPIDLATRVALQGCEALAEAHAAGIIHRDLKPENLFLTRGSNGEPLLKIVDFGVSKRVRGPRRCATIAGTVGSPHYMAPEQLRSSRDVDQRADVWGFGAVLYELLSGRSAFEGENVAEICAQVLTVRPAPLHSLRPEVGPTLSRVIARCLEVDRNDRYQSMDELAAALRQATGDAHGDSGWPLELASNEKIDEIPGVRRYRLARIGAALGLTAILSSVISCAVIGPTRTLELARRTAATQLIGHAHAQRVPQSQADRFARAILPAPKPEPAAEPPPPPPPPPKPRLKKRSYKPPVKPEVVVLADDIATASPPNDETTVPSEDSALR